MNTKRRATFWKYMLKEQLCLSDCCPQGWYFSFILGQVWRPSFKPCFSCIFSYHNVCIVYIAFFTQVSSPQHPFHLLKLYTGCHGNWYPDPILGLKINGKTHVITFSGSPKSRKNLWERNPETKGKARFYDSWQTEFQLYNSLYPSVIKKRARDEDNS